MTHCDRILEYMRQHGSITQKEATDNFGCTRLSGRIYDLHKRGIEFNKTFESGFNRFGEPEHHVRYSIKAEQVTL